MREATADAPGRVNLIGEHTDYHDGFVMPCAIPQRTHADVRQRTDRRVHAVSHERPAERLDYALAGEAKTGAWGDYVQGVTWALREAGYRLTGFDLALRSTVPLGTGLSSSAALEVALIRALRALCGLAIDDVTVARVAQRAEVAFVGAPVGIMDQMACSLAAEREALYLDTRSLAYERLALPASLDVCVIDSGVTHQHAGGDYAVRRRESEDAAACLGVGKLREAGVERLPDLSALPPLLARRARHVITENARVLAARDALHRGDLQAFGTLLNASHDSLRDDYEVSVRDVDTLVDLAREEPDVYGARMTGGGFGGAVVIAAVGGRGRGAAARIVQRYVASTGRPGAVIVSG